MSENVNKVVVNGKVVVDLTSDTIDPDKVLSGYVAHDASGKKIIGRMELEERSVNDLVILDSEKIEILPGYYPDKITIWLNAEKKFEWSPFNFQSDYISPDDKVFGVE